MEYSNTATAMAATPAHVRIPHEWMSNWLPKIGASAFAVYAVLLKFKAQNETAWPKHETIAAESGLSPSTVKRALKVLSKHGLCHWEPSFKTTKCGKSKQTSNIYFIGQNDPPRQSKKTYEISTPPQGGERDNPAQPLTAAEETTLIELGVKPFVLVKFGRHRPEAFRHALRVIEVKAKWFSKVAANKRGAAIMDIAKSPARYALEAGPQMPPDVAEFIQAMPKDRRENIAWCWANDKGFPSTIKKWATLDSHKKAAVVERLRVDSYVPFGCAIDEAAG